MSHEPRPLWASIVEYGPQVFLAAVAVLLVAFPLSLESTLAPFLFTLGGIVLLTKWTFLVVRPGLAVKYGIRGFAIRPNPILGPPKSRLGAWHQSIGSLVPGVALILFGLG